MIAPTVDPSARVLGDVRLGPGASVGAGAVLQGPLVAGARLQVHPRALVGGPAQHRRGDEGRLELGDDVVLRECCTVHRGSPADAGITRLGDRVWVLAYAHIGHDCVLGDDAQITNGAQLGGHCQVGAGAVLAARCCLHQFVRVGRGAMVAAGSYVSGDVPPWSLAAGDRAVVLGPNGVALRRAGLGGSVAPLRRALRCLLPGGGGGKLPEDLCADPAVAELIAFVEAPSRRALCRWGRRPR